MAVASGGTQKIIGMVLDHLKIRHLFDAVVTSEMVKNQKPAPDIFLEAARRIGVEPKFCRAYEDTDLGLQAIRAAGMEAVDVRELRAENYSNDSSLALAALMNSTFLLPIFLCRQSVYRRKNSRCQLARKFCQRHTD